MQNLVIWRALLQKNTPTVINLCMESFCSTYYILNFLLSGVLVADFVAFKSVFGFCVHANLVAKHNSHNDRVQAHF